MWISAPPAGRLCLIGATEGSERILKEIRVVGGLEKDYCHPTRQLFKVLINNLF